MRVQALTQSRSPHTGWASVKSKRSLMLVGAFLIISVAINAMIIFLAGGSF